MPGLDDALAAGPGTWAAILCDGVECMSIREEGEAGV